MRASGHFAGVPAIADRAGDGGGDLLAVDRQADFGDALVVGRRRRYGLPSGRHGHAIGEVEAADVARWVGSCDA